MKKENKIKLIFGLIVGTLFFSQFVSAESTKNLGIKPEIFVKDLFVLGEKLTFDYTLIAEEDLEIIIAPHIFCPSALVAPLEEIEVSLKKGESYLGTYSDLIIDNSYETQVCEASILFINPEREKISKSFSIQSVSSINLKLDTCKDKSCVKKSKMFLRGAPVYFDYSVNVEDVNLMATLIWPDGTKNNVDINSPFVSEKEGSYELSVVVSKENYLDTMSSVKFVVVSKLAGEIQRHSALEEKISRLNLSPPKDETWLKTLFVIVLVALLVFYFGIRKFFN